MLSQILGWGIPIVAVGANVCFNLPLMGNDPRCMIGWEAAPKWAFFGPMILMTALSLLAMFIVMCNLHAPALRNAAFAEEMKSSASGIFAFTILQTLGSNSPIFKNYS
jgi:hypothetical protein